MADDPDKILLDRVEALRTKITKKLLKEEKANPKAAPKLRQMLKKMGVYVFRKER